MVRGAKAHGWHNELWAATRGAHSLSNGSGSGTTPSTCARSPSGPRVDQPEARERNDKAVAQWVADEFPRIVRETFERKTHYVFLDESGFFLARTVRRTQAPRGKAPALRAGNRRDKWSATRCTTVSPVPVRPGRYFELLDHNVHGEDVVPFLKGRHRRVDPQTVIWDRNPIHSTSKAVQARVAKHPSVVVEDFPGYAPS